MIETKEIRVDYGDVHAVADLTVSIPTGEVYGLIGPNGAGKTSLIRVLATLLKPTYGDARIANIDVVEEPARVRRLLGYMPDLAPVYEDLRCWEFLDLFGAAYFVSRRERRRRIDACIDQVGLQSKRQAIAGTLSLGMKQRLVLAKTLLPDPEVLLLDEPASGLDPMARIDMRNMIRDLAHSGKTILISSHILNELSEFCGSIGIMEKGRLILSGRIDEILASLSHKKRIVVETLDPAARAAEVLSGLDGVSSCKAEALRVEFDLDGDESDVAELLRSLVDRGIRIKAFYERQQGVEDIFLQIGAKEVS
ncbi:MAG: ABC transporter ATP-binding protein [Planctomycetes bacterium]|nr:ABC transporter ATP-binding protein [Planctomycetota bacterium]